MNALKTVTAVLSVALLVNACKQKDFPDPLGDIAAPPTGQAKIMFVYANTGNPNAANIFIDQQKANTDSLRFDGPSYTNYIQYTALTHIINANTTRRVDSSSTSPVPPFDVTYYYTPDIPTDTFMTSGFLFNENESYTFFASDLDSILGFNNYRVLTDDLTPPSSGRAKVRFINLAPDLLDRTMNSIDAVLITPTDTTKLAVDNEFYQWSQFVEINAGAYNFNLFNNLSQVPLIGVPPTFQLDAGKIYTIYSKGFLTNSPTQPPLSASWVVHN